MNVAMLKEKCISSGRFREAPGIADSNSAAIIAMSDGNNRKAYTLLSQALLDLETKQQCCTSRGLCRIVDTAHLHGWSFAKPANSQTSPLGCCEIEGTGGRLRSSKRRQRMTVRLPERVHKDGTTTALFNKAFLIHREYSGSCTDPGASAAILMYNQALSCQIEGLGSNDSNALYHAATLYSRAYDMLLLADESCQSYQSSSTLVNTATTQCTMHHHQRSYKKQLLLLTAAILHNTAAIHGYFWNHAEARLMRCQLAQVIHHSDHGSGNDMSQEFDTDDFVFFHLGIFFALIDDFGIAPAA